MSLLGWPDFVKVDAVLVDWLDEHLKPEGETP